jgi:hypothetical protein
MFCSISRPFCSSKQGKSLIISNSLYMTYRLISLFRHTK